MANSGACPPNEVGILPVQLAVKGEIAVLRLEPGDVIVVSTQDRRLTMEQSRELQRQVSERFPDHEVLITNQIDLSIQRNGGKKCA